MLGKVADRDVLELGCRATQWSIALHRQGARMTALDNSAHQLAHARGLMGRGRGGVPARARERRVDRLGRRFVRPVLCGHGAMTFADPHRTIPEAARLLRVGGLLACSMHTPIVDIAWEPGHDHPSERLSRDYRELHALHEPGEPVADKLPYGTWIRVFRNGGFVVEDLLELRSPGRREEQLLRRHRPRLGAALADGAHLADPPSGRHRALIADRPVTALPCRLARGRRGTPE